MMHVSVSGGGIHRGKMMMRWMVDRASGAERSSADGDESNSVFQPRWSVVVRVEVGVSGRVYEAIR